MIIVPSNVGSPIPSDPSWANVSLLVKDIGINGATNTSFYDDGPYKFLPTRTGDVTQGSFSPFVPTGYWSNYFDGSGDYLTVPSNSAWAFGTGAFTVELWINPQSWPSTAYAPLIRTVGGTNGFALFNNGGNLVYHIPNVGDILSASLPPTGSWSHIALCRSGTTVSMFVNGTRVATATNSTNQAAADIAIGGSTDWNTYVNAYISNVRVVKGSAVYDPTSATLTVPAASLSAIAGTSLLTCQDNRFKDNSSNNFTLTKAGDVSVSRLNPFGPTLPAPTVNLASAGSVYVDGNTSYLSVPDNTALQMSTGDFTVEMWWNPANVSGYQTLFDKGYNRTSGIVLQTGGASLNVVVGGSTLITAGTFTAGAWHHVAVTRSGSTVTLYVNGISVGSGTSTANLNSTDNLGIGSSTNQTGNGAYPATGYVSNVRVVKGSAVYTSNFTPSTSPLTAISGTSLLTAQDAVTVTDASSNNFTVTKNANAKAVEASPFKRVSTIYGGSAYFDGSGDDIRIPANAAHQFGYSDFTVEFWVYIQGTGSQLWYGQNASGDARNGVHIGYRGGHLWWLFGNGGWTFERDPLVYPDLNAWNHIAVSRSGGQARLYLNGVLADSINDSTNLGQGTHMTLGAYAGGYNLTGYMSNLRVIKGSGIYTSNFTPPTSPVTAISGTTLLLNFDNAGIYDGSGNVNMQSVGDSKTSTAVTKFSPGAATYLDGSGDSVWTTGKGGFDLSGPFTVEAWVNFTATSGRLNYIFNYLNDVEVGWMFRYVNTGVLRFYFNASEVIDRTWTASLNTWYHVAVTRDSSNNVRMFIDGVLQGSATTVSSNSSQSQYGLRIGSTDTYGYIQDARITKGVARYTSTFTPPAIEAATRKA